LLCASSSYDLPHRVHDAHIYPIIAPNGSTIIIYGYDDGITIVWRGGRPFKKSSARQAKPKEPEIIMIDDSDDEPAQIPADEFDNDEAEFDEEEPYDRVVHTETIQIDSPVLHLEVPKINLELNGATQYSIPSFLREKLVVAVACADSSVRLLNMTLSPTRNSGRRSIEEISIVESQQSPFTVSRGLAMTWTAQQRTGSSHEADNNLPEWSLLVATHSARAGARLAVYQIALVDDGAKIDGEAVNLIQEEYLQSHMTRISFNSAPYPAQQHSQLLLAVAGAVRIYEPCPRKRYGQQAPAQGSWLASFYVPFQTSDSTIRCVALGQRSHVLDARWICNGQAVMVLLQDGQWGLWDIEGIAPEASKPSKRGNFNASSSSAGVSGGGVTRFTLQGYVGESSKAKAGKFNLSNGQGTAKEAKKLTPMTPSTRKVKQQALFTAPDPLSKMTGLPQGGISVEFIAPTKTGSRPDDSVVIWYGNALYSVPSVFSYWQRIANGSSDNNSLNRIEGFSTSNETITNVSQAPSRLQQTSVLSSQRDILVSAEHRLLMLTPAQSALQKEGPVKRLFATEAASNGARSTGNAMDFDEGDVMRFDQDMLSKGQLDIGGLDRMLSGMNGGNDSVFGTGTGRNGGGLFGDLAQSKTRRVGFAAGF